MIWERLSPVWQACCEEAWAACCAGTVPIGSAVTDANGSLLVRAHNRINGAPGNGQLSGHVLAHAEINALTLLDYNAQDPHSLILYTTMEPCPLCLGAIYMSGLRQFHYACRDPYAGSANLLGATPYLRLKPVRAGGPQDVELEDILAGLHGAYKWYRWGQRDPDVLIESWRAILPRGVAFGEALFQSGAYAQLIHSGLEAGAAFDELHSRLEKF